ncbi:MAG: hypothetical protein IH892_16140 [Planctomycetes bacterium]|nr:hypothetical protein [Planctomycetota bacterium]
MNRILWDFLKRWTWFVALLVCLQLGLASAMVKSEGGLHVSPWLFFAGYLVLVIDDSRGVLRVLLQTPVARHHLSLVVWLVSVPIPALLIFGVSLLCGAFWMWSRALPTNFIEKTTMVGVEGFLLLGSIAFAGSFSRRLNRLSLSEGLQFGFSLIVTVSFLLLVVFSKLPRQLADCGPVHFLGAGILLLCTILGLVRRERTFIGVLSSRPSASRIGAAWFSGRTGDSLLTRQASGGIPFLVWRACRESGAYLGLFLVFIAGCAVLGTLGCVVLDAWSGRPSMDTLKVMLETNSVPSQFVAIGLIMVWVTLGVPATLPIMQLKSLRTLPLSSSQISSLIIGLPLTLSTVLVAVLCCIGRIFFRRFDLDLLLGLACCSTTIAMVTIPLMLRWRISAKSSTRLTVAAIASLTFMIASLVAFTIAYKIGLDGLEILLNYRYGLDLDLNAPVAALLAVPVVSVVGAYTLTRHYIVHTSHPYR